MKKFSKILTLILALVAILTAFTVVALAEDAAEPGYVQPFATTTFDGYNVGASWETNQGEGTGGALTVQEAYPDGNKYLYINGSTSNTSTLNYSYMGGGNHTNRTNYNMSKYPIVAFDFDLMTPDGDWGLFSTTSQNDGNSAGLYFRPYYKGQDISNGWFKQISFGALGLPTTAYKWHHVTVVFVYSEENVEITNEETGEVTTEKHGFITQTTYVNGKALTNSLASWVSGAKVDITAKGATAKGAGMFFGPVYIKSARNDGTNSEQVIDNMQYTYYEAGYDISKLPTAVYNENWEAPFGKLLATVDYTDAEGNEATEYFDDLGEANAFAQANPGSKVSLAGNMTTPYYVDSELTIDANIYDENGVPTGVYTGVLENARTTKGYYLEETAEGSGIYVATKGDFMVSQSDGSYIAYPESEFTARIFKANSTTLKLLNDIEVDAVFTVNKTNYTIDLNGYALKRISYYGNVYNYDEAVGDYVQAETGISSKGTTMFTLNSATGAHSYGFLITSSNGQGAIYNINYKADHYYNGGVLVKRDNLANQRTTLLYTTASYSSTGNKFTFENFDHYGGIILNVDYNGRKNLNFYFDNIRHYQMNTYASNNAQSAFYLSANVGFNLQVTNSLFYFNDHATNMTSGLIRLVAALTDGYTTDVKFTNCDIIANNDGADKVGIMNSQSGEDIQLIDCRIYNFDTTVNTLRTSQGTLVNYEEDVSYVPTALDGWSNKALAQNITKTYTVPNVYTWAITDGEIQSVNTDIETKEYACTFNRICTKAVDVDLVDGDSTKTIQLFPGVDSIDDIRVVHELSDNDYLNVLCQWTDAAEGGNAVSGVLGLGDNEVVFDWETAKVTLYAQDSIGDVTKYVGGIKDINFNLGFLSGFRYNLYTPVENEMLTDINVDGYTKGDTVTITGEDEIARQYTVWSKLVGTAAAADANVISATFKVGGVDYSQSWSINAVQYAEVLIEYPEYETEKPAIGNMVKLIKEAKLALDSEADVTALDTVIASAGVSAGYADYTDGNADALADFSGIIADVNFVVYNGVASYKFILVEEGAELTFTNANGEAIGTTVDGTAVILDVMRVYDLIAPITVTSGDISATFTMVDYLTKLNNAEGINLAKALYEFGVAADAYKAEIMANN